MRRAQSGFTLLELLVVITIMGLIAGLIAWRGTDRARSMQLPQAVQNLAAGLRLARVRAIARDTNVTFVPPRETPLHLEGSHRVVFSPAGSATAGRFVLRNDTSAFAVTVDALTGRVKVQNVP